jgi:two-component system, OmpR family, sensor histidine kinase MtrB
VTAQPSAFPARLRRRLAVAFTLVAGISSGALAVGADVTVQSIRTNAFVERSRDRVRDDLRLIEAGAPTDALGTQLADADELRGTIVIVGDGEETTIGSLGLADVPAGVRTEVQGNPGSLADEVTTIDGASALVVGTATDELEVYRFFPREDLVQGFVDLRRTLALGWLGVVVAAAVIGTLVARRTLRPVRTAAEAARSVAEGLLDTRLPVRPGDEFGEWAAAFNEMVAALDQKIEALARAQARERRFAADIAHELRTPLGAVLTAASHLGSTAELPDDAGALLEIVLDASRRLDRLTSELLELHRLEAGQEEPTIVPVHLRLALESTLRAHGWAESVCLDAPDVVIETDPRRLDRIVVNLVANAVHHGGTGVAVTVTAGVDTVISVSDAGPGVAPEDLPRLFDRHYKASGSRDRAGEPSRASGGSGLGLAIARESAHLLGGRIEVDSAPGEGATFRLVLPTAPLARPELSAASGPV